MKMRYKVNFHVLLCFLSSCSTTLAMMTAATTTTVSTTITQQTSSIQTESDSKTNPNTNNDTQVENSPFLLNIINNDSSSSRSNVNTSSNNSERSKDGVESQYHKIHLASPNEKSSSSLASNDGNGLEFQTVNGVHNGVAISGGTTQSLEVETIENHRFKSMSLKKEPWPSPAASNQLNNKYFVNQVQSNFNSTQSNVDEMWMITTNPNGIDGLSTIATSQTVGQSIEHHNKYFTRNVSSQQQQLHSTQISPVTMSPKSRLKSTLSPVLNRTKTGQHHHHHQHGSKNTGAVVATATAATQAANRTHFQIAQKQLTLSKNIRTEPPPMLNHILDSLSVSNSKHLHHDHRYGPHFEDIPAIGNVTNVTVPIGNAVYLNCRISLLQDKTVSWVRRGKPGESGLELLTVGQQTYSGDSRYKIEFQYPNNWKLKIESVVKEDEGTYECQISTYPPRVIQKNIFVIDPKVVIIDEEGSALQDKYYEVDSTLQLSCIVRNVKMTSSAVYWSHGERILNYDVERGGISVKTEILEKGANSSLLIAKINKLDSGNYSCFINATHEYTVSVHVLNGESFAELHHGNGGWAISTKSHSTPIAYAVVLILLNVIWLNVELLPGR